MGSFRILQFLGLVGFCGILGLISVLIRSALVDTSNLLIEQGMLSVDTVNTLTTILTITQYAPVISVIAVAIWAISGAINDTNSEKD